VGPNGHIEQRIARFTLYRLLVLREVGVLDRVLADLDSVAILGWLVPAYLLPWMRRPSVQQRIADYLGDPDRNLTPYLSTWLMAAMLDVDGGLPNSWIDYARKIGLNRDEDAYHRSVAMNVLALGRMSRDLSKIEDVVKREYDPDVVRGAVVALARVRRLTRPLEDRANRIVGLSTTLRYLRGRQTLPSLIFQSNANSLAR